jgi:ubiquinone/menaquinone biosynthesis C-methylase UbiE
MAREHRHGLATHDGSDRAADEYDVGRAGRWRAKVAERSADVALAATPVPLRVLDVGCGTGLLLRELVDRLPNVLEIVGVDPSPDMLRVARENTSERVRFVPAAAEQLPFGDGRFDLVVSTMSFHHWPAQEAGLAELGRVLAPDGALVLIDLSARWIRRTDGRAGVRNPGEIVASLGAAGLPVTRREVVKRRLGLPYVRAFVVAR